MALSKLAAHLPYAALPHTRPNAAPVFVPEYDRCEKHGNWQRNIEHEDGAIRWLPHCPQCAREQRVSRLINRAAIPLRFQDRTLANYRVEHAGQRQALEAAQAYAKGFTEVLATGRCFVMVGNPGTGKNHLACGIAHHIMETGHTALFVTVSEAIRAVRRTWSRDARQSEEAVLQDFTQVDLLILDEVGVQYGTEAEQVTLFEIINRRYNNLKPIIILSNLPAQANDPKIPSLRTYLGARAFDRLREGGGCLLVFDWESYRSRRGK